VGRKASSNLLDNRQAMCTMHLQTWRMAILKVWRWHHQLRLEIHRPLERLSEWGAFSKTAVQRGPPSSEAEKSQKRLPIFLARRVLPQTIVQALRLPEGVGRIARDFIFPLEVALVCAHKLSELDAPLHCVCIV